MKLAIESLKKSFIVGCSLLILAGISMRFYQINANIFFYYDEGMYLTHNIGFLDYMQMHPPAGFKQFIKYLEVCMHVALSDGKALWFFIANLRSFIFDVNAWFFTRLVSAIFGTLTLFLTYRFAQRYFHSAWIGLLALGLLAVFPSHVYYSRLGIQEALSTFCFLLGMYWYIFPKKFQLRTILSGVFFACVFFSNYRMIVIPALVFFVEIFGAFAQKRGVDWRKYVYNTLTFLAVVFLIGNIDHGANTKITFAWMFYQKHLAATQGKVEAELFNHFAYPYFIFRFETILFGLFFFGNIYLISRKEWKKLLPFALACCHMVIFSFALEKSVRFLCVVMPFMVMAVAGLIGYSWQKLPTVRWKNILLIVVCLMVGQQFLKSYHIMHFQSDYENAMMDLKKDDSLPTVLSTQFKVQQFFAMPRNTVAAMPHQINHLVMFFQRGYRYIVIDPQAYVSYTKDGARFSQPLQEPLNFILTNVPPKRVYEHFSPAMLERFVLEHNVNLRTSLAFLQKNQDNKLGKLYVYDIKESLAILVKYMQSQAR
ncbi:MAG: phospholipid carrier-dependent glycosyltransferase [Candidatus Omnitrophica bacterium]|nr:phospholipid carrier-dependent glycosyltransferase [Candidatus Omnitrophota bacterium]